MSLWRLFSCPIKHTSVPATVPPPHCRRCRRARTSATSPCQRDFCLRAWLMPIICTNPSPTHSILSNFVKKKAPNSGLFVWVGCSETVTPRGVRFAVMLVRMKRLVGGGMGTAAPRRWGRWCWQWRYCTGGLYIAYPFVWLFDLNFPIITINQLRI